MKSIILEKQLIKFCNHKKLIISNKHLKNLQKFEMTIKDMNNFTKQFLMKKSSCSIFFSKEINKLKDLIKKSNK